MGSKETMNSAARYSQEEMEAIFLDAQLDATKLASRGKLDAGTSLLAQGFDTKENAEHFKYDHELGKHTLPDGVKPPSVDLKNFYSLTGSVDRVRHRAKSEREKIIVESINGRETNWYEAKSEAAMLFLTLKDHINLDDFYKDGDSKKEEVMKIVEAMASMKSFTDVEWARLEKDNKFPKDLVYGPKGAFNLLLAFQRSTVGIPINFLISKSFVPGDNGQSALFPTKITLKLAKKRGDRPKDRYTLFLEVKRKKEEQAKKKVEEDAKKKAEEEDAAKKAAEEAAKKKAEEEAAAKKKAEEDAAKKKAEEDAAAKKKAEEAAKKDPALTDRILTGESFIESLTSRANDLEQKAVEYAKAKALRGLADKAKAKVDQAKSLLDGATGVLETAETAPTPIDETFVIMAEGSIDAAEIALSEAEEILGKIETRLEAEKKALEAKEAKEKSVSTSLKALKDAGFGGQVFEKNSPALFPSEFGEEVYLSYGKHRVLVTLLENGRYNYKTLSAPDSMKDNLTEKNVTPSEIKAKLDANPDAVDEVNLMKYDLFRSYYRDPVGNTYEIARISPYNGPGSEGTNTYVLHVKGYQESKEDKPGDYKLAVLFDSSLEEYRGWELDKSGAIDRPLAADSASPFEFMKDAMSDVYDFASTE